MGDVGLIPGLGRSPGEGHGNRFHYSSLENLTDRQSMGSQGVGLHWNDLARMQTIIDAIFQKCWISNFNTWERISAWSHVLMWNHWGTNMKIIVALTSFAYSWTYQCNINLKKCMWLYIHVLLLNMEMSFYFIMFNEVFLIYNVVLVLCV